MGYRAINLGVAVSMLVTVAAGKTPGVQTQPRLIGSRADRIQPYRANPRYWQYKGKPILLLGGSKDDNLFQIPDLHAHIDEIARVGGNYIRNTMSDRRDLGFEVPAFERRPDGKYDLDRWNPEYWRRFSEMLRLTYDRNIIVQIEVWDRFDYWQKHWARHPFNPINNVNYTEAETGLGPRYDDHPANNQQPFFFSTPGQRPIAPLLKYQQRFVDEMLRRSLPYPNILYCMDNETAGAEAWGAYWAGYIRERARAMGVEACVTEMWDDWNITSETHHRTLDHPETYTFADVSQNNQTKGQVHWDRFQTVRSRISARPRPINTVKTYGADGGPYGSTAEGVARWWRHLIGGAAAVRFHRPITGLGLSDPAKASIKAGRLVAQHVRFWQTEPQPSLLRDREEDEAYVSARPEEAYVVFFPRAGAIGLDGSAAKGALTIRWVDIVRGVWGPAGRAQGGQTIALKTPGDGMWAAVVTKR